MHLHLAKTHPRPPPEVVSACIPSWFFFLSFVPQLCHHSCLKITKYEASEPQKWLPPSLWPDSLPRIPLGARHGSVLIIVVSH